MTHASPERAPAALVFDMDGTLVDNMACHSECWVALVRDNGIPMTLDDYWRAAPAGTAEEVVRLFFGPDIPRERAQCLVEQKEFLYRSLFRGRVRLVAGARKLLTSAARAGIPLALASAAGRKNVDFVLGEAKIASLFSVVVCADDGLRGKPHPDIYEEAARRLGIAPARCVAFEDSRPGIEAARHAGMRCVAIATSHPAQELGGAPGVLTAVPSFTGLSLSRLARLLASK